MSPAEIRELELFTQALEGIEEDLDRSPCFDQEIRDNLKAAIEACKGQLKSDPAS